MSRKVEVQFQVNSLSIMKATLKDLGIAFNEQENSINISRRWNSIEINGDTGKISYDSDNELEVNKIKQAYTANFYVDQAIRQGAQLEKVQVGNQIHLIQR